MPPLHLCPSTLPPLPLSLFSSGLPPPRAQTSLEAEVGALLQLLQFSNGSDGSDVLLADALVRGAIIIEFSMLHVSKWPVEGDVSYTTILDDT